MTPQRTTTRNEQSTAESPIVADPRRPNPLGLRIAIGCYVACLLFLAAVSFWGNAS